MSGRNVDMEKKKERLRAIEKEKALGKRPAIAIDKGAGMLSYSHGEDEQSESQVQGIRPCRHSRDVMHLTSKVQASKRLKTMEVESTIQLPHSAMTTASQSSVDMAHHLASIICLPGDRNKMDLPLSGSNEQALAHCSQTMMWIASQTKESGKASEIQKRLKEELETERKNRVQAEKATDDLQTKMKESDRNNKQLSKDLTEANTLIGKLKMEVKDARTSEEAAQAIWYSEGLKDRLLKVKEVMGARYIEFLIDDEIDPIQDNPLVRPTEEKEDEN